MGVQLGRRSYVAFTSADHLASDKLLQERVDDRLLFASCKQIACVVCIMQSAIAGILGSARSSSGICSSVERRGRCVSGVAACWHWRGGV